MKIEGGDAGLNNNVSRNELASSEIVPLETVISHTYLSCSRKKGISVLSWAMPSLCEPLRKYNETGFELTLEAKFWKCFPTVV